MEQVADEQAPPLTQLELLDDTIEAFQTPSNGADSVKSSTHALAPEQSTHDDITDGQHLRPVAIEIALPMLPKARRSSYVAVKSNVVDHIIEQISYQEGDPAYKIEYTDGREATVSSSDLFGTLHALLRRFTLRSSL